MSVAVSNTEDVVSVSSAELERLRKAEELALVYGWTAVNRDGPRERVAYELWSEWYDLAGYQFAGPRAHPDVDARVKESEREWKRQHR